MRSIKIPFLLLAMFLVGGVATAVVSAMYTAIILGYQFCFSEACISFALDAFKDSLQLVKFTLEGCASLATILGVFYALKTYMDSVYSRLSIERRQHYSWFTEVVAAASRKSHVEVSDLQAKNLYNFIFPSSGNRLQPSSEYLAHIELIKAVIDDANQTCGAVLPFCKATHAGRIYPAFRKVSIFFEEERDADIITHEEVGFRFLDEINKCILETDIRLQCIERLYKPECS